MSDDDEKLAVLGARMGRIDQPYGHQELAGTGQAILRRPGEGHPIDPTLLLRVTAAETAGTIGVVEGVVAAGEGPARHVHYDSDEFIYVLEGRFRFLVGDRMATVGPGACVFIPRRCVHAFRNAGHAAGRLLVVISPGGLETLHEHLGRARATADGASCSPVPEPLDDLAFVGPPLD